MSRINAIQNAIIELDGGTFQKLLDAYLFKKYDYENIQPLGMQTGTNKVTKGVPDSFVKHIDGTYTFIMYGSVKAMPYNKIKEDILSCIDADKVKIEKEKIRNIICAYTSTNISVGQIEQLGNLISGIKVEMLGLGTISHDLLMHYPKIAADFLNVSIDTGQIFKPESFVSKYDKNGMNAPLSIDFKYREKELKQLKESIGSSNLTLVSGQSGIGKTKLVIEACKEYENEGFQVFCIKNNGELLYDDIRYYFSNHGDYILFIDDANQTSSLEYIFQFVVDPPKNIHIKIVATVRDYAKKRIGDIIQNYFRPSIITVEPFKGEEIKHILLECLGIKNEEFSDKIVKIAKGNARLAILAGKSAIEKGFRAINNATDIFKNYYGSIVDTQDLDKSSVNVLFVVSLLGPFRIGENRFAKDLLRYFDVDDIQFLNICHTLNEKELVDLYHNEIVKISDQSLGNYILEYVLIEKKSISIFEVLKVGFPDYKHKIIYSLNTLISLFYTTEIEKYIKNQVNKSWDSADLSLQKDYLHSFYSLNEEKSLQMIKSSIDEIEPKFYNLKNFDIEKKKNYNNIKTDQIEILCGFKYSDHYNDALELLFYFFNKRPDLVMDFYFAFSDRFLYDKYSHKHEYEKEYLLINKIWEESKFGENENMSLLLIHIIKKALDCKIEKTESGYNNNSFNLIRFSIIFSEGTKKLRRICWEVLSHLYNNDQHKREIESILSTFHGAGLDGEHFTDILEWDLECIKSLFIEEWDKLTFEQCNILKSLKDIADRLTVDYDKVYNSYKSNEDFMLYCNITMDPFSIKSWREEKEIRKNDMKLLIKDWNFDDFTKLFKICQVLEEKKQEERWLISQSIQQIFSLLTEFPIYVDVVKIYLTNGAPYGFETKDMIISKLIELIGVEETKKLINKYEFNNKSVWQCTFWEAMPESSLTWIGYT